MRKTFIWICLLFLLTGNSWAEDAKSLYHKGCRKLKAGRYEEAIAYLEKTVKTDEDYAAAHYALAFSYEKVEKLEEAKTAYSRYLELTREEVGKRRKYRKHARNRIKILEEMSKEIPAFPEILNPAGTSLEEGEKETEPVDEKGVITLLVEEPSLRREGRRIGGLITLAIFLAAVASFLIWQRRRGIYLLQVDLEDGKSMIKDRIPEKKKISRLLLNEEGQYWDVPSHLQNLDEETLQELYQKYYKRMGRGKSSIDSKGNSRK